jgi:demethylmenaquinone methyltransferase/2-methoxy-6-polyprenyl-1,4-benzoquinol methylase
MIDWLDPSRDGAWSTSAGHRRHRAAHPGAGTATDITVCDLTPAMLEVGRDRAIDRGRLCGIAWVAGIAEALPLPDMHFDACTIAFCLRNVADQERALAEAYRVLRPGGRFLCLEFSRVAIPALARLYDLYSFNLVPWLGERVADDRESYQYLVDSIRKFPDQKALAGMMTRVGLRRVTWRNLSGGIAALHRLAI